MINTVRMNVKLPPHRIERLFELLDTVDPGQKRISVKKWQKLLGELRSMTLAIPGGRVLLSILQEILAHKCDKDSRLRLSPDVHDILGDFRWLAKDLQRRPTRIAETIPASEPATLGAQYAAGAGMGGVHFVPLPDGSIQPLLWRLPFSSHIQSQLVSFSNPTGKITNSELELAVSVAQHDMLAQAVDIWEAIIHNASNNVATVWWQSRGGISITGPAARLLRLQALHQRHHRYVPQFEYIPGPANAMSNDCSRRWDLSDSQFLAHFARVFPQNHPWQLCQLRKSMCSAVTSVLLTNA